MLIKAHKALEIVTVDIVSSSFNSRQYDYIGTVPKIRQKDFILVSIFIKAQDQGCLASYLIRSQAMGLKCKDQAQIPLQVIL